MNPKEGKKSNSYESILKCLAMMLQYLSNKEESGNVRTCDTEIQI